MITHIEMAAFSNHNLLNIFYKELFARGDSFGGNEMEFVSLVEQMRKITGRKGDAIKASAKMDQSFMLARLEEVIGMVDEAKLRLSRIHIHTINSHFLCFRRDVWKGGKTSLLNGVRVSLEVAGQYESF